MKKCSIVLLLLLLAPFIKAQRDSLRKFRVSGIQVDFGPAFYTETENMQKENYLQAAKNDPFLNADLSDYKKDRRNLHDNAFVSGFVGLTVYADLKCSKKIKKQFFIGLRYEPQRMISISYTKETYDTVGVFTGNGVGNNVYEIKDGSTNYNFNISSEKLMLPIGFNFTSNREKVCWFSLGIELVPVFSFNYLLTSTYETSTNNKLVKEGDSLSNNSNYLNYTGADGNTITHNTALTGMRYGFSAAVPFAMYLRLSKKAVFFKHLQVLASIRPAYMYSNANYSMSTSQVIVAMTTGIRYNW